MGTFGQTEMPHRVHSNQLSSFQLCLNNVLSLINFVISTWCSDCELKVLLD